MDKEVKRVRIYISGLGYSEAYVNGCKIGDHVLDPGNTDYAKEFYIPPTKWSHR